LNWFGLELDAVQEVERGLLLTGVPEQAELAHICCTGAPEEHDILDDCWAPWTWHWEVEIYDTAARAEAEQMASWYKPLPTNPGNTGKRRKPQTVSETNHNINQRKTY
jgi:hypothetical protein